MYIYYITYFNFKRCSAWFLIYTNFYEKYLSLIINNSKLRLTKMFEYYIHIILLFLSITVFLIYIKMNKNDLDRIPGLKSKYPLIGNLNLFKLKGVPITQCN